MVPRVDDLRANRWKETPLVDKFEIFEWPLSAKSGQSGFLWKHHFISSEK